MKVIVINGSPRNGGNSDVLCDQFLKGAQEAGCESEKVNSLVLVALNLGAFASPYGALLIEKISWDSTISGTFYTISVILILMTIGSRVIKFVQSGKVEVVIQE